VVYSGQTDVEVVEGTTTSVSLTLVPTSTGTGSIYIYVTWGTTSQITFTDYGNNPVLSIYNAPGFPKSVSQSKIFYDNGLYKMYYIHEYYNGKGGTVWYAESLDGINWTNKLNQPVLDSDSSGTWDDYGIAPGAIIKDGNIYRLYYNSYQHTIMHHNVGIAFSTDGITWTRNPAPIFSGDSLLNFYTFVSSVIKVNSIYYMYYWSSPITNFNASVINVATSSDGINWVKYSGNPILSPTYSWEGIGLGYPSVIFDKGNFIMIYSIHKEEVQSTQDSFGLAYSNDGLHWTKKYSTPIFNISNTLSHWTQITYPCLIKINNEYRLYYTGVPENYEMNISFARSYNIQ